MRSIKTKITIAILLFINFIFCYKYTSRYIEFGIFVSLGLLALQFLIFKFSHKINLSIKFKNILCYGLLSFFGGLVIVSHFKIPLESLDVDRWSVISSFLTELYKGNYPYYATSHMGNFPGPMPFYFLIASLFHWIGALSILSALGYGLFTILLLRKATNPNTTFLLFYVSTSFYLVWEITTRSNLFTFSILVLLILNEFLNIKNKNTLKFYALALLTGFILSTRSVYILPYIIFFLSSFISKEVTFKRIFIFLSIAFIAFIITFIPFLYFFYDDFFVMNPFIIQSSFLVPKIYTISFIVLSIVFAFFVKVKTDKFFYSGLSLFIAILIYALYHLFNFGYELSYIKSTIDISYFIFCVPFLLKYVMDTTERKNILKVY